MSLLPLQNKQHQLFQKFLQQPVKHSCTCMYLFTLVSLKLSGKNLYIDVWPVIDFLLHGRIFIYALCPKSQTCIYTRAPYGFQWARTCMQVCGPKYFMTGCNRESHLHILPAPLLQCLKFIHLVTPLNIHFSLTPVSCQNGDDATTRLRAASTSKGDGSFYNYKSQIFPFLERTAMF